jgi:CO dehydrogenase/acetyl-CoA synthase beta subunit
MYIYYVYIHIYTCIHIIGIDPDELSVLDIRKILETLSIKEENHEKCIENTRNNLKDFSYLLIERLEEEEEENNELSNEKDVNSKNTDLEITDFIPAVKVLELAGRGNDEFNGIRIGN